MEFEYDSRRFDYLGVWYDAVTIQVDDRVEWHIFACEAPTELIATVDGKLKPYIKTLRSAIKLARYVKTEKYTSMHRMQSRMPNGDIVVRYDEYRLISKYIYCSCGAKKWYNALGAISVARMLEWSRKHTGEMHRRITPAWRRTYALINASKVDLGISANTKDGLKDAKEGHRARSRGKYGARYF